VADHHAAIRAEVLAQPVDVGTLPPEATPPGRTMTGSAEG
jgi:hypothetical protein